MTPQQAAEAMRERCARECGILADRLPPASAQRAAVRKAASKIRAIKIEDLK